MNKSFWILVNLSKPLGTNHLCAPRIAALTSDSPHQSRGDEPNKTHQRNEKYFYVEILDERYIPRRSSFPSMPARESQLKHFQRLLSHNPEVNWMLFSSLFTHFSLGESRKMNNGQKSNQFCSSWTQSNINAHIESNPQRFSLLFFLFVPNINRSCQDLWIVEWNRNWMREKFGYFLWDFFAAIQTQELSQSHAGCWLEFMFQSSAGNERESNFTRKWNAAISKMNLERFNDPQNENEASVCELSRFCQFSPLNLDFSCRHWNKGNKRIWVGCQKLWRKVKKGKRTKNVWQRYQSECSRWALVAEHKQRMRISVRRLLRSEGIFNNIHQRHCYESKAFEIAQRNGRLRCFTTRWLATSILNRKSLQRGRRAWVGWKELMTWSVLLDKALCSDFFGRLLVDERAAFEAFLFQSFPSRSTIKRPLQGTNTKR